MRTELPEKWYIKTTKESNTIVCDWYNKVNDSQTDRTVGNYYCKEENGWISGWMHFAPEEVIGFDEITFEEFKTLVLGEKQQPTEPQYEVY